MRLCAGVTAAGVVLLSGIVPVWAAEETAQRGPSLPTGPQTETGPQGHVGPAEPTGPRLNATPESTPTAVATSAASGGNTATGSNSDNANASTSASSSSLATDNRATIGNDAAATLTTGANAVNDNSAVGTVATGAINGSLNVINSANSTFAPGSSVGTSTVDATGASNVTLTPSSDRSALLTSATSRNSATGADSTNANTVQGTNVTQVRATDQAGTANGTTLTATTGANSLNRNTSVAGLQTGDINLAVNLVNLANINRPDLLMAVDVWSVLANPDTQIIVPSSNVGTGAHSTNANSVTQRNDADISVIRHANLDNALTVASVTGNNEAVDSTSIGPISSGSTTVDGSVVNVANTASPTFYVVNVFGEWHGAIVGLDPSSYVINQINDTTGADSTNANNVNQNSQTDVSLASNADVRNRVTVNATTGNNTLAANTLVGSVKTGAVNVLANLVNMVNSFGANLNQFSLGILNIFGRRPSSAGAPAGSPTTAPVELPQDHTVVATADTAEVAATGTATAVSAPATAAQTDRPGRLAVSRYVPYWVEVTHRTQRIVQRSRFVPDDAAPSRQSLAEAFTDTEADSSSASPEASSPLMALIPAPVVQHARSNRAALPIAVPSVLTLVWLGLEAATRRKLQKER